jgi:transposase InsO family protein
MSDKYAAITALRDRFPVRLMCAALDVSLGGFYDAAQRARGAPSAHAAADERLLVEVRTAHAASHRRYGAPRVHQELRAAGTRVAKKRVARLMQADGLVARRAGRRRPITTDARHGEPVAPNTLARRFAVPDVAGLNHVWVADITYVPTRAGWLYLAVVLDLASRRVVGWATHDTLEQVLTLTALGRALRDRRPPAGLLCHTDRGGQYASGTYRALLAAHGLRASMSRRGDCYDNAVAESFFATLEHELLAEADFGTRGEARHALFDFIEIWYNRQRRHSSLGYVSPVTYEQDLPAHSARAA